MQERSRLARRPNHRALVLLALSPAFWCGCGGGTEAEKGLVPVSGRVTLDGGSWPQPGQITFVPAGNDVGGGQAASRSATATFDSGGNFDVAGGSGGGRGLLPGAYAVAVDCPEGDPEMADPGKKAAAQKNAAPPKFRNSETSKLTIKVGSRP